MVVVVVVVVVVVCVCAFSTLHRCHISNRDAINV